MMEHSVLPRPAPEVAILVTGAAFRTSYELYAHYRVSGRTALTDSKIATIVAGHRPADLDAPEQAAYDLAVALTRGGPVPDAIYAAAESALGGEGAAEVVFIVATYFSVCVLLNGFAMPVPDAAV